MSRTAKVHGIKNGIFPRMLLFTNYSQKGSISLRHETFNKALREVEVYHHASARCLSSGQAGSERTRFRKSEAVLLFAQPLLHHWSLPCGGARRAEAEETAW